MAPFQGRLDDDISVNAWASIDDEIDESAEDHKMGILSCGLRDDEDIDDTSLFPGMRGVLRDTRVSKPIDKPTAIDKRDRVIAYFKETDTIRLVKRNGKFFKIVEHWVKSNNSRTEVSKEFVVERTKIAISNTLSGKIPKYEVWINRDFNEIINE